MKRTEFRAHGEADASAPKLARGAPSIEFPASAVRAPDRTLQWLLEGPGWPWARAAVDVLAVCGATAASVAPTPERVISRGPLLLLPLFVVLIFQYRGFYRQRMRTLVLDGLIPTVGSVSIAVMGVAVLEVYVANRTMSGGALVRVWVLVTVSLGVARTLVALVQRVARARFAVCKPTLILGSGIVAAKVARRLDIASEYGMRPVGYIDSRPAGRAPDPLGLRVLGGPDELELIAARTGARQLIVAFSSATDEELLPVIRRAERAGMGVSVVPRLFDALNGQMAYDVLGGMPLLGLRGVNLAGGSFAVKHAFDRVASAVLLLLFAPLFIILATLVKLTSSGPVLFRQRRVGCGGRTFDLYKFRSMRGPGADFEPQPDSGPGGVEGIDRRTTVGRLMRRTSLDEIPQLLNVLRGEMSLVGPRPERPRYAELFGREFPRYNERHLVRPGITGWAQVHGFRGQTSMRDRIEWDNYYIAHWSVALDVKIFLLTITALLAPE